MQHSYKCIDVKMTRQSLYQEGQKSRRQKMVVRDGGVTEAASKSQPWTACVLLFPDNV